MEEIIFLVEESEEGGYIAKGMGVSIYTEAETLEDLRVAVKEAVHCHFEDNHPKLIRLHLVKEEVFSV
ncbi:MAG: 2-oxoisovalerate dehydrogenase [Bacteroidetes bacterium]|nr:2-oxoisovalerate dehydrogenase [Bacteroidota bacterium]